MLLAVNQEQEFPDFNKDSLTAYLNTTYMKLVKTPQIIMVKARLQDVDGPKLFMEALIVDGEEVVLAKAEALLIMLRQPVDEYVTTVKRS